MDTAMKSFAVVILLIAILIDAQDQVVDEAIPEDETVLTIEDFDNAQSLTDGDDELTDTAKVYKQHRFEGDIAGFNRFVSGTNTAPSVGNDADVMRNAVRDTHQLWPNGRVPYTISARYTSNGRRRIARAFQEYQNLTCIRFVPRMRTDKDYIFILPDDGCYSLIGKAGGRQYLSLVNGCFNKGTILHELMHALGFFHEQSRTDRDKYVTIQWQNIEEENKEQFDSYSKRIISDLGTPYDYSSIMHYDATAFSKNGRPTIVPKQPGAVIGNRADFTANDLYKINKLYQCQSYLTTTQPSIPWIGATRAMITPSAPTIGNQCKDLRVDCSVLSTMGLCRSPSLSVEMNRSCSKTCGFCLCDNERPWCHDWARIGMCTNWFYTDFMRHRCAQSCGFCENSNRRLSSRSLFQPSSFGRNFNFDSRFWPQWNWN